MPQDFEEFNVITLSDDEGNEVDFELVDAIEHNGKKYCILYPEGLSEEEREDEEPLILEYVLEGAEDFLEEIIDDDEYDEIYNFYFGGDYES